MASTESPATEIRESLLAAAVYERLQLARRLGIVAMLQGSLFASVGLAISQILSGRLGLGGVRLLAWFVVLGAMAVSLATQLVLIKKFSWTRLFFPKRRSKWADGIIVAVVFGMVLFQGQEEGPFRPWMFGAFCTVVLFVFGWQHRDRGYEALAFAPLLIGLILFLVRGSEEESMAILALLVGIMLVGFGALRFFGKPRWTGA